MKHYELVYLISPDLSSDQARALAEKTAGFINELSGLSEKITEPETKKLAYPIKKKQTAHIVCLSFSLSAERVKDLDEKIKSENEILRYMILEKKKEKLPKEKRMIEKPKEKKVEIEKMDKKIDEILK